MQAYNIEMQSFKYHLNKVLEYFFLSIHQPPRIHRKDLQNATLIPSASHAFSVLESPGSEGLAASRSRRTLKDRHGRKAAFERLRDLKGSKHKYEVNSIVEPFVLFGNILILIF